MGSNPDVTRTPSAHLLSEARHDGAKLVVLSPDLSATSKHGDWWIPIHSGQDGAFWMAAVHVILRDFHAAGKAPAFTDYLSRYTDAPFLVRLEERDGALAPGRLLKASELERTAAVENAAFKYLVWDGRAGAPRMPLGSMGFRWQSKKGEWNLQQKDGLDGEPIEPTLSFLAGHDEVRDVAFADFAEGRTLRRGVPVKICRPRRAPSRSPPSTTSSSPSSAWGGASRAPTRPATTTRTRPTRPPGRSASPASIARTWCASPTSGRPPQRRPAASARSSSARG